MGLQRVTSDKTERLPLFTRVMRNQSREIEFILLGLTHNYKLWFSCFSFQLHIEPDGECNHYPPHPAGYSPQTPMHFFLCCFSFLEIIFTTVCTPKYVVIMVTKKKTIAYNCAAQLFFLFCELQTITFWLSCPMTAMLPSANRYITLSSWTAKFVISLYSDLE